MFFPFFSVFLAIFLSRMWEGLDQVSGRMKKFGDHIQKLNAKKEDQNIGGDMGVFYGGDDRSIGHNLYFLDSTEPIQRSNDSAISVATSALQ